MSTQLQTQSKTPVGHSAPSFVPSGEKVSVGFTEEMKGYIEFGRTDKNYQEGHDVGKKEGNFFMFHLTITIPDIDFFVNDPREQGVAAGWVECKQLGGKLQVEKGVFNLFVDTGAPDKNTKNMRYRLFFTAKDGRKLTMIGHKIVKDDGVMNIWHDTTTLYTQLLEGHVEEGKDDEAKVAATGIIIILVKDFAKQMTTIKSDGSTFRARADAVLKFGHLFMGTLWDVYAPQVFKAEPLIWEDREIALFTLEGVKDAEITTHPFSTDDKLGLQLMRFKREESDDVIILSHGLTTSTDMYIMPEQYNLVNYLHDNGFGDVWSFDWRGSMRYNYNLFPNQYSLDDIALFDYPAAFAELRRQIGPNKRIHVICHCVGSISFFMSYFAGMVDGVTSIVSNSVSLTPRVPGWSRFKLNVVPGLISYLMRFPNINPNWSYLPGPGIPRGKIFSKINSWFHPECDVPACHMLSLMWGTGRPACYEHANLNEVTHRRVGDLFGAVEINYFRHIRKMVGRGVVIKYRESNAKYNELPNNYLDRAQEIKTPIMFMTGDKNKVFTDSNIVTYETLKKLSPDNKNELFIAEGYGHQDTLMGKHNDRDIFPHILKFLKKYSN